MSHKYIKEITDLNNTPYGWSENTGRDSIWLEQRKEYGFDERETWSLDITFFCWLYERLMMFKEVNIIDLDFHKLKINGEELTQGECINKMIDNCKAIIQSKDSDSNEIINKKDEVLNIWKECIYLMWW